MRLTEQQVFDYITCPAYYDMKYNKKIPCQEPVTMQSLLDIVARYFYSNLLNGKVCTMNELKKKWDSICEKNRDIIDSRKNLEGMNYIINLARWASNNKIYIADFNSAYSLQFDDITIEGIMGAVTALPGRKCELLISRFSNREPDKNDIDRKLKYTMDCYAFLMAYNKTIDAIKVVHFKNLKEITSCRTQLDYERLKSTVKGTAKGIVNESYYPRESVFCSSCFYKHHCKYWS